MRDYIEVQTSQDHPPWCMSLDLLTQAYETFTIKVIGKTSSSLFMVHPEYNVYQLMMQYMSHNPSYNINLLGVVTDVSSPKVSFAGIRLKKVPK